MSDKKILLTSSGLAELQEELRVLREEKRVEIANKLKEAISYGDLSENAEYQEARDDQAQVELRIAELEELLKPGNYEIIEEEKSGKKRKAGINVGATVTVEEVTSKDKITYIIVGSQEASILDGKISNESPLGKAIVGKNVGDTISVVSPAGKKEYVIVESR
ncbi:MAG: transcription elongation factor GreA [Patescibacteria group bacterium]